ncbi:MAG: FtsX-like permease family protein [Thermodesulfobacteriota bacterium]
MNLFRIAWRNLWRNPRRAVITCAAVALTTAILIASYALMEGMILHSLQNACNLTIGEAEVHDPGYMARRSLYRVIPDPGKILTRLSKDRIPASARTYGFGLAAHGVKSAGVQFWGIDPQREKSAFDLANYLESGTWLPETPNKTLVLGKKLARSLDVKVGDEIVAVVQAADGSMGNDLYTVAGILKSAGDAVDRDAAIMNRKDFGDLFVMPEGAHEIAANTKGRMPLAQLMATLSRDAPGMEVKSWRAIIPALADMANLFDAMMVIFGLVFFLAGGLGVMNTMLMATFERIREFGIQKALGATGWRIVREVAAEALVLSLTAELAGVLIGVLGAWYLQIYGIDTSAFSQGYSFSGVAVDTHWRAILSSKSVVMPALIMAVTSVLASLYPALLAARLTPVKAITHV